jgi:hypothetical protein
MHRMDALPVQEETHLPYSSTVDWVMHAWWPELRTDRSPLPHWRMTRSFGVTFFWLDKLVVDYAVIGAGHSDVEATTLTFTPAGWTLFGVRTQRGLFSLTKHRPRNG